MSSFLFGSGVTVAPYAMVDAANNAAVVQEAISDLWGERIARNIAVSMGARAGLVSTIMTGAQLKETGVHYTMTLAHHLGCQVLEAQRQKSDVPEVVGRGIGRQGCLSRGRSPMSTVVSARDSRVAAFVSRALAAPTNWKSNSKTNF